jgi:hypothetical protein
MTPVSPENSPCRRIRGCIPRGQEATSHYLWTKRVCSYCSALKAWKAGLRLGRMMGTMGLIGKVAVARKIGDNREEKKEAKKEAEKKAEEKK